MRPPAQLLAVVSAATLMSAVMVAAPTWSAAQTAPTCTATLSQGPPIYTNTELTVSASGLTPHEADVVTVTHDGSSTGSDGEADASGVDSYTFTFAAGSWEYAWVGRSSGATCSVSWTVLDASASTTTTAAPTTTSAGNPSTTSTTAASTTTPAAAAEPVSASPAFTG